MKKICSECKTENEEQFLFCKNCGNPLEEESKTEEPIIKPVVENNSQPVYNVQNPYGVPVENLYEVKKQQNSFEEPGSVSGIEKEEFTTFIGKNGDKIYSKFAKMEYSGSKISWCWPAAILQYTLGFLGGAIWFFYRKMYGLGIVVFLITTLLGIPTFLLDFQMIQEQYVEMGMLSQMIWNVPHQEELAIYSIIANLLVWILRIALMMFFNRLYYQKVVGNVKKARVLLADKGEKEISSYFQKKGGTGLLVPIIFVALTFLASFVLAGFIVSSEFFILPEIENFL